MMKRKAQEEMVGFVLIMLVVAVIFLVFLGIYLRSDLTTETDSEEISQFLEAAFEYTTDCGKSQIEYYRISQLIIECNNDESKTCSNNPNTNLCDALEETLKGLIEASWTFDPNSPQKQYQLGVIRETSTGEVGVVTASGGSPVPNNPSIRSSEKPLPGGIIMRLSIWS